MFRQQFSRPPKCFHAFIRFYESRTRFLRCHAVPTWLRDPFNKSRAKLRRFTNSISTDLLPFKALSQRGKGGVYQAVDLSVSPARLVIIKEGRRHGETDWLGHDGFARIQHEA